jgi:hypothetical protein
MASDTTPLGGGTRYIQTTHSLLSYSLQLDQFKARQLAALKHELAVGIDQLEQGRYRAYDDTNVIRLAEEAGKSCRERLTGGRKNPSR